MALGHGAKIVKNGLVFAYDMGPNPGANKSWKGKPTTNLHTNTDTLSGWYFVDSSYSNGRLIAGTGSAAHFVLQDKSVVSGTVYTQSVEVKYDGVRYFQIAPSTGFSSNFAAFDLVDGTVAGGNTSAASIVDIGNGYYRCSYTATATSTTSSGRMAFGPNESSTSRLAQWVGNGANGVFLRNPQIEANSFATPFVNGTRSNTEALLDWTGNNTITINGLTYNSDGTFNYYGTNGTGLILPGTNFSLNEQTIECWCYASSFVQSGFMFEKTTNNLVNTQYSFFFNGTSTHLYYRTYGLTPTDLTRATSTSGVINNQWNHMVATFDGSTKKIYVNGAQKASAAVTGTITQNTTGSAYIGTYGNFAGYPYNGQIGVTRIYDRALTADEVTTNFNALRGRYGI